MDSNGGFVFEYILDADVKEEKKAFQAPRIDKVSTDAEFETCFGER